MQTNRDSPCTIPVAYTDDGPVPKRNTNGCNAYGMIVVRSDGPLPGVPKKIEFIYIID